MEKMIQELVAFQEMQRDYFDCYGGTQDLSNRDFSYEVQRLSRALRDVNLDGLDFSGKNLREANFSGLRLIRTNFEGADLRDVNFQGSYLLGADLVGANLAGADMTGARVNGMIIDDGRGKEYVLV